jgi:general stress protein 26
MTQTRTHNERIKDELREAGVTRYGLAKFASKYLPSLIRENEHIEAVAYGRYKDEVSTIGTEGMLIATNIRVIFLDHKPGYTTTDEISYDVVSGIKKTTAGFFSALTLHTRISNYTIRFANAKCVDRFVHYVGERRLEKTQEDAIPSTPSRPPTGLTNAAIEFLKSHEVGVFSTVDRKGSVHGAAVYYTLQDNGSLYILTKAGTQKVHDVLAHHQIAFTVFDEKTAQTLQLQASGELEADRTTKDMVFAALSQSRTYARGPMMPPVTTLHEGAYTVLRIIPYTVHFTDYTQRYKDDLGVK